MKVSPSRLIPLLPFEYVELSISSTTAVKLLPGKSDRVSLVFSANFDSAAILPGSNFAIVSLAPGPFLTHQNGFVLSPESPTLKLAFRDVGSLVNAEWYASTNTNGARISVVGTSYTLTRRLNQTGDS